MLIIEGTDGLGKTTLAKKLAKRLEKLGHIYAHFTRLPDSFDRFSDYMLRSSVRTVQDRFHMSEIAYIAARGDDVGAMVRTMPSFLTPLTYRLVDAALRLKCAYTVVITAERDLITDKWNGMDPSRSEMYDHDVTQRANCAFLDIVEGEFELGPYEYRSCDFDAHLHLTKENPWPSDAFADVVLQRYAERFAEFMILKRRADHNLSIDTAYRLATIT